MDFLQTLLYPIKLGEAWVMYGWHWLFNAIGLAVNYAVYAALVTWGEGWLASPYVAAGCGSIAGLGFNYLASSRLVFGAAR